MIRRVFSRVDPLDKQRKDRRTRPDKKSKGERTTSAPGHFTVFIPTLGARRRSAMFDAASPAKNLDVDAGIDTD
jgi:hypothetical protein